LADPVRGDPFRTFAGFASQALSLDTVLTAAPGVTEADVLATANVALDAGFASLRAAPHVCAQALAHIAAAGTMSVRDILLAFPVEQRRGLEMGLGWMAKYGFVDWPT
jgi:hypothetical protein